MAQQHDAKDDLVWPLFARDELLGVPAHVEISRSCQIVPYFTVRDVFSDASKLFWTLGGRWRHRGAAA